MEIFLPYLCFIFLVIARETNQSHWFGGVISWAPVDKNVAFPIASTNVNIRQRYFDRLGFNSDDSCSTPADVATGTNIVNKGSSKLISQNGPSWEMSAEVFCYDYNVADNWQAGDRTQLQVSLLEQNLKLALGYLQSYSRLTRSRKITFSKSPSI